MSERDTVIPDAPAAPPPAGRQSAGAMLRAMREAAGVDAALLASAMKVSPQKLDALENDRLDALPDITFARGLASAICRAFGADPAPVLERMPLAAPGLRTQGDPLNQPFRRAGDRPAPMVAGSFSKPVLIAIGALLIAAAALWLLPTLPIQLGAPPEAAAPTQDGVVHESVEPAPAAEPVPAEAPAAAASDAQEPPAPVASVPEAAATPGAVLGLDATGETWVTVRDAAGKPLLNRALAAGETLDLGGELPLAVTIGRKDAVSVTVRGQPFDLKSLGPSNVARFTVK
mgnify:CR=1 FL=1